MDLTALAVPLAWFTLMGAPLIVIFFSRRERNEQKPSTIKGAAAFLAVVVVAWACAIDFAWRPLSWLAIAGAYLCWCTIVGALFRVKPHALGVFLGVLGSISLLPGVLLSTIGIIGLFFVVADYSSAPDKSVTLEPGLDCIITGWGNVVSDEGHDVHLYRYFPWFPLLRYQLRRVVVDETNPTRGIPENTGCAEVAHKVNG